jgi:hypothetical protein
MPSNEEAELERWPMHADMRVIAVFGVFSLLVTTAPIWRSIFAF